MSQFNYITSGPPTIPAPTTPSLAFDKVNDVVYVSTLPTLQNAPAWVAVGGAGGVSVDGVLVGSPDFDSVTPSAPSGMINVVWQTVGSQISGYVPNGTIGGDQDQVQFNNNGGFDGDPNFLWDASGEFSPLPSLILGPLNTLSSPTIAEARLHTGDKFSVDPGAGNYFGIVSDLEVNSSSPSTAEWCNIATRLRVSGTQTHSNLSILDADIYYNSTGHVDTILGLNMTVNTQNTGSVSTISAVSVTASSSGDSTQVSGGVLTATQGGGTGQSVSGVNLSVTGENSAHIVSGAGCHVSTPQFGASVVVDHLYGVYIADQTAGVGNADPWALYSVGGNSFFQDKVFVGPSVATATTPVRQIQIAGTNGMVTVASSETAAQGLIGIRQVQTISSLQSSTDFSNINTASIVNSRVWNPATPIPGTLVLTSVDTHSGSSAVYHGTITSGGSNAYAGAYVVIFGFVNGVNNGIFLITASTTTTLTVVNASSTSETHAASALFPGIGFTGILNHVITDPSSTQLLTGAQISGIDTQLVLNGKTTGGVAHSIDGNIYGSPGTTGTAQWDDLRCIYGEILFGDSVNASTHNATKTVGLNSATHGWLTPAVGTIGTSWGVNIEGPRIPSGCTVTTRKGIRMASQAQTAGGTNTDPWGIFQENATEKNALGKINLGGSTGPLLSSGTNTPEGAVTAPVGSIFLRTNGGANTTLYVKESGAGNTGWVAK